MALHQFSGNASLTVVGSCGALPIGSLVPGTFYKVTGLVQGRLGTYDVIGQAVDSNTFGHEVHVATTFDQHAWDGWFNWATCQLEVLTDNVQNTIEGATNISNFSWGQGHARNFVKVASLFTMDAVGGTIWLENRLTDTANVITTGSNIVTFARNIFEGSNVVNLTNAAGPAFEYNHLSNNFTFSATNSTGLNIRFNALTENGSITANNSIGLSMSRNTINGCNIIATGYSPLAGSVINDNVWEGIGGASFTATGQITFIRNLIHNINVLSIACPAGNHLIAGNRFFDGNVTFSHSQNSEIRGNTVTGIGTSFTVSKTAGSGLLTIYDNDIDSTGSITVGGTGASGNVSYNKVWGLGQIIVSGLCDNLQVRGVEVLDSNVAIQAAGNVQLYSFRVTEFSSLIINQPSGVHLYTHSSIRDRSNVSFTSAQNISFDSNDISAGSGISILKTAGTNTFTFSGNTLETATVNVSGTGDKGTISNCTFSSSAAITVANLCDGLTISYCHVSTNSSLNVQASNDITFVRMTVQGGSSVLLNQSSGTHVYNSTIVSGNSTFVAASIQNVSLAGNTISDASGLTLSRTGGSGLFTFTYNTISNGSGVIIGGDGIAGLFSQNHIDTNSDVTFSGTCDNFVFADNLVGQISALTVSNSSVFSASDNTFADRAVLNVSNLVVSGDAITYNHFLSASTIAISGTYNTLRIYASRFAGVSSLTSRGAIDVNLAQVSLDNTSSITLGTANPGGYSVLFSNVSLQSGSSILVRETTSGNVNLGGVSVQGASAIQYGTIGATGGLLSLNAVNIENNSLLNYLGQTGSTLTMSGSAMRGGTILVENDHAGLLALTKVSLEDSGGNNSLRVKRQNNFNLQNTHIASGGYIFLDNNSSATAGNITAVNVLSNGFITIDGNAGQVNVTVGEVRDASFIHVLNNTANFGITSFDFKIQSNSVVTNTAVTTITNVSAVNNSALLVNTGGGTSSNINITNGILTLAGFTANSVNLENANSVLVANVVNAEKRFYPAALP